MATSIQLTDTEHRLEFGAGMNAVHLLTHFDRIADGPDAVPRLRRFILDLAVRGKLAPQDLDDEPASELLKRIAAAKAQLIKAGEIRKPRELGVGEALTVPFEVPQSWQWVRLDSVGAIIGGGTPPANEAVNFAEPGQGIPWLTPADLGRHSELFISRGSRDLTEKGLQSSSTTLMPGGTVLFTSRAPIGYVAIAANPISTNQGFKSVVPYVPDCSRFIALAMQCFAPEIDAKAPGTTFREVSGKIVAGVPFPLPPLAEQHRIVAKVDELMALCDRLEAARTEREATRNRLAAASLARLNAPDPDPSTFRNDAAFALDNLTPLTIRPDQIKALRQTILNLAVRGKLVPQDPNDEPASELLREIAVEKARSVKERKIKRTEAQVPDSLHVPFILPVGWAWSTLGGICSKTGSGSTPRGGRNAYRQEGVVFLRSQNVYDEGLRIDDVAYIDTATHEKMSGTGVRPADLLLNITGGSLGRCCRVPDQFCEANVSQHVAIIRVAINGLQDFVHLLIRSPYFQSFIFDEQTGAGRGGLPKNRMDRIPVALPPFAEQLRIVAKVDELMALCDRLEASLTTGDETRGRLLESVLHEALEVAADGDHEHG